LENIEQGEKLYEAGDEVAKTKMVVDKTGAVPLWMAKSICNSIINKLYEKNIPLPNCSLHFGTFQDEKKIFAIGAAMAVEDFVGKE